LGSGENTFLPGAAIAVIHCGIMLNRRDFLAVCSQFGLAGTLFPGVLYAQAAEAAKAATNNLAIPAHFPPITAAMIQQAADIAGVVIPPGDVPMMLDTLTQMRHGYRAVRALDMPNSVAPAYIFDPLPKGASVDSIRTPVVYAKAPIVGRAPANLEDLAFSTVGELAAYIRTQKVSSLALTEMYIARLKRYNPELHFLITLTEERALAQARAARYAVGGERSAGGERLSHDVGRGRL
jgi:hypothetical protein